jgi:hypothetical protein
MTDSNLIEQAKLGDPQAIAELMNQSLQSRGMRASVDRQGDCLEVVLEAERVPNRQSLTTFVQQGIDNLGVQSIRSIRILGQQFGASYPAWMQELQLGATPPLADFVDDLEIAPSPIQPEISAETSSNFSLTEAEIASPQSSLETADFSNPRAEAADLWDEPAQQPDFLQELMESDRNLDRSIESQEPSVDLQTWSDEDQLRPLAEASPDDNLADFLQELSDTAPGEPFPTELSQVQASLVELHAAEPSEAAAPQSDPQFVTHSDANLGFQADLVQAGAEFDRAALDWEDSTETIAAGEPDQDWLEVIKTSESAATLPDENLLNEYPDAVSIDQLPDNWLTDAASAEAPPIAATESLPEPSPAFLSELLDQPSDFTTEPLPEALPDLSWEASTQSPALSSPELSSSDEQPLSQGAHSIDNLVDLPVDPTIDQPSLPPESRFPENFSLEGQIPERIPEFLPEARPALNEDLQQSRLQSAPFEVPEISEPIAATDWEPTILSEATPDFVMEPVLHLPESDPAEMTLAELQHQPEVLDATIEAPESATLSASPSASPLTAAEVLRADRAAAIDIEEIPPDFLLELQDAPPFESAGAPPMGSELELPASSSEPASEAPPEPMLDTALAMEMAAALETAEIEGAGDGATEETELTEPLSLDSDSPELPTPEVTVAAAGMVETPGLAAELASLDLATPESWMATAELTATGENLEPAPNPMDRASEWVELSETTEGTAIEPPVDWIAATQAGITSEEAEFDQSQPMEPTVSQADLEAGLGEFRSGFAQPAPLPLAEPATLDDPDWRNRWDDPLSLDEEDEEANYIIEDEASLESQPPPVYTLPPTDADRSDADRSDADRSDDQLELLQTGEESTGVRSSWIFPVVLLVICGWLAGLLGFSLFSSRLTPQPPPAPTPSDPPPASTPPAPPAP